MDNCVIFCAGAFDGLIAPIAPEDYIIAADGGLTHCQKLEIRPACILGDFDSLGYVPEDSRVFPVEKDDTDAMLAVRRGLEQGCRHFLLYGSLDGPRLDHTLANLQTLQFLADHGADGHLIGSRYIASLVKDSCLAFPANAKGIFSVFCMGEEARGVTIQGGKYSLEKGRLTSGHPLGVSNHFMGQPVRICVAQGSLIVLYDRENGPATYTEETL